jgi:orotate phosphoribosyltransferase
MVSVTQVQLINRLLERQALRFGDFTLKSGKKSPYFINTGCLSTGGDLEAIGSWYADTINEHWGDNVDVVFGPAYKGIPLALAAASGLERKQNRRIGWSYDRKEVKAHGDGGAFVGAPLENGARVVVVDDVLTAGTALRESLAKLADLDVTVLGAVISVDREEPHETAGTNRQALVEELRLPIEPLIGITAILEHLQDDTRLSDDAKNAIATHLGK